MDKEKNKVQDIVSIVKKYTTKKNLLSVLSITIVLALAVVSSIPEFLIDFSQIATTKFITKTLMQILIGLTCLLCMTTIGQTSNAENPTKPLYKARMDFRESAKRLLEPKEFKRFKQWIMVKYRPSEQLERDLSELQQVGISDIRILNLPREDIEMLKEHAIKKDTNEYYSKLNEKQYEAVIKIKEGKTALRFLAPTDYLSETNRPLGKTREEILETQYQKRTFMYLENIASKILMIIAMGVLFGSIAWQSIEEIGGEASAMQKTLSIAFDIITKFCTAIFSSFTGFLNGEKFNDFDSEYLRIKISVHNDYLGEENFVAKTENELAREEWIKQEREINKLANEEYARKIGLITNEENDTNTNNIIAL